MANDRVSRETAELIPLPPHTWYVRTVGWLLEQEKVQENIKNVPANEPLKEALKNEGIRSPFLCMPNWYPIAGSQRLRVLTELPELHEQEVRVCRFDKEWWLLYYLWGDTDFRDKAVAVWFQMAELVWKSMYYEDDPTFLEHEALGDELEWKHKSKLMGKL
tara:strand:- start:83 stop:565 length:483 start_codon:yes stop_codon:yes gene_type:complete